MNNDQAQSALARHDEYRCRPFDVADLAESWLAQFERWLRDAQAANVDEPNAMVLATVGRDGRPSARNVLLKAVDPRGFVFYTNLQSQKSRQLVETPAAALVFSWLALRRQVVIAGAAEVVDADETDEYWASRPVESRISAIASPQSTRVSSRRELEDLRQRIASEADLGERPSFWGGWRITPETVEFWQGREHRLHDRLCFRRSDNSWVAERLAP